MRHRLHIIIASTIAAACAGAVLGTAMLGAAVPPANSLLTNGSFENSELATFTAGSWEATTTRVEQAGAPDGKWVAQTTGKGAYWSWGWWAAPTSTNALGKVQGQVFVKSANSIATGKTLKLAIREKSGSTVVQTADSKAITLTTSWQPVVVEATLKAASDHVDMYALTSGAGGSIYVDSAQFVPMSASVNLANTPCKVKLESGEKEGTCSGAFTPKVEPPPTETTPTETTPTETTPTETTPTETQPTETTPPPPPPSGAEVPAAPAGPPAPSGSTWHAVFADAFGSAIGTGGDTFWKANTHAQGCCSNGNEIAAEHPSKVRVGSNGLELLCTKESVEGKAFDCSGIDTSTTNGFNWKPNGGQTWAFTVEAKWPQRDLGEDPGWWSTDTSWTDELDMWEAWEWNHEEYYAGIPVWKAQIGGATVSKEIYKAKTEIPNPEEMLHTYTTVITANSEVQEWIDGIKRWTLGKPSTINAPWMHLIITHALREATHLTGTSVLTVRYAAVYEDSAHAGQNVQNGGVAPGTVLK